MRFRLSLSFFYIGFVLLFLFPISVSADEGVFLKSIKFEREQDEVATFKKGDRARMWLNEDEKYEWMHDREIYSVDKSSVLIVSDETLSQIKAKEGASIYVEPHVFSERLIEIEAGSVLTPYEPDESEGGDPLLIEETLKKLYEGHLSSVFSRWFHVETKFGIKGYVHIDDVEVIYNQEPVQTTLYLKEDFQADGVSLAFREGVSATDYIDGKYLIEKDGKQIEIEEKYLSFKRPFPKEVEPQEKDQFTILYDRAKKELGKPYVFGANGPDAFDCSSFTQTVFQSVGKSLPRTASSQSTVGVTVEKSNLSPGDLVFFETYKKGPSHVGIYVGNGQMIHAGTSQGVSITSIDSSYFGPRYLFGKRIF